MPSPEEEIDVPSPFVLVTGATGFIASHIIAELLATGHRVRGTIRGSRACDEEMLRGLPGAPERLELVEADLVREGSFDRAAAGCDAVVHTASPYMMHADDPQRDLVEPAVVGTRNVLTACARAGSVRRVVLTSSMAAVTDEPENGRVLTEVDWNTKSSLERNPYYYSKTLAEQGAWNFIAEHAPSFDLVVINPFVVIGPSLMSTLNTSNKIFVDLVNGVYPAVLSLTWGFVDVRDVANAHLRALSTPWAHGRYICAGETVSMRRVVDLLRKHGYGRLQLPRLGLDSRWGDVLVRLMAYRQQQGVRSYLRTHVGRVPRYGTTKIKTELGVSFRPAAQSILETMADLERWGHLG
jgi:dihydroflavonol-4-reductase